MKDFNVVVIYPEGDARKVNVKKFLQLRELVEGNLEMINFGDTQHWAYINEDGIALGLPYNKRATDLCHKYNVGLMDGDYIKGNFVVVGAADEHGNDLSISEELAEELVGS